LGAAGTLDTTMFPAGIGQDQISITASESLAAGAYVNIWDNTGAANARNASGAAGSFKPAHGFVLAAAAASATAVIYRSGQNTGQTGLTPGTDYYLSTTTAGAVQSTAPASGSGYLSQKIGQSISATVLDTLLEKPVQLI
jgi:hypothetical protein